MKEEIEKLFEVDKINARFDQFIIAIDGVLIAYSFRLIENEKFSLILIPILIAILFWSLSFYFGIRSLKRFVATRSIEIFKQRTTIENVVHKELIEEQFQKTGKLANRNNKLMYRFLYTGCIFFITWQILKMISITYFI